MTPIKLYPKCHPFWITDNGSIIENKPIAMEYCNRGYVLPCCWLDSSDKKTMEETSKYGLYDESLQLENNHSIRQIMISEQWVKFHKILFEDQENAHSICKFRCSEKPND
jgi:hypothetical protein